MLFLIIKHFFTELFYGSYTNIVILNTVEKNQKKYFIYKKQIKKLWKKIDKLCDTNDFLLDNIKNDAYLY